MPQRLPIPLVIALNSFETGGTEHQMTELVRRLDRRRFSVNVACLADRGPRRDRVARVAPIVEFPISSLRSMSTARQLFRFAGWCRSEGIQILQACDFYANIFAMPGAALAGVPVRIAARRDVYMPERTAGQQRLQRLAYQLAHHVVANSEACVERLIEEGVAEWRIARVENGIDVGRFPPAAGAARRRVITTVANLRPGKGHDVLLRAAARVVRRVPDVRFQIVGEGAERVALEQQAADLRISAQVVFLGHRDDVPQVLQESDLFAFPSPMEAAPNAVIEAMAAALPIVASRTGGIPELIAHERTGLLVTPATTGRLPRPSSGSSSGRNSPPGWRTRPDRRPSRASRSTGWLASSKTSFSANGRRVPRPRSWRGRPRLDTEHAATTGGEDSLTCVASQE